MWCARWFMPLMILPLPTAPPYFCAVFLISVFLHSRPCFYCIVLVTALFTSSCYWQAIPIDTPLSYPLGDPNPNTTVAQTFREAILANISLPFPFPFSSSSPVSINSNSESEAQHDAQIELPPVLQLLDRCWCNVFSRSGMFEPTDVRAWEEASVLRARRELEMWYARPAPSPVEVEVEVWDKDQDQDQDHTTARKANKEGMDGTTKDVVEIDDDALREGEQNAGSTSFSLRALRDLLFPTLSTGPATKYRLKPAPSSLATPGTPLEPTPEVPLTPELEVEMEHPPSSSSESRQVTSISSFIPKSIPKSSSPESQNEEIEPHPLTESDDTVSPPPPPSSQALKLFRPYYDLRPYGLDVTVDFRWH